LSIYQWQDERDKKINFHINTKLNVSLNSLHLKSYKYPRKHKFNRMRNILNKNAKYYSKNNKIRFILHKSGNHTFFHKHFSLNTLNNIY